MDKSEPSENTSLLHDQVHSDGWENVLTGLGVKGKDKRTTANAYYTRSTQLDIEETHAADDMFSRIVELPAEEMMREGFEVIVPDNQEISQLINEHMEAEGVNEKFTEALELARQYGGATIVLGLDDGNMDTPEKPLNPDSIKSIDYCTLLHRFEALGRDPEGDISSPNFGLPRHYNIQPDVSGITSDMTGQALTGNTTNYGTLVHHSRLLRFDGERISRRQFVQNEYWGESVLVRIENSLRNFNISHDAVAAVLQHFNQAVYKLQDLNNIITSGNEVLLEKRMAMIGRMRSVLRSVIIQEGEEFQQSSATLTGVKDVLNEIANRLVQATGIPHTILLGESPSGMGATGESETKDWYDKVSRMQKKKLQPPLEKYLKYLFLSKEGPTKGVEPEKWSIKFNSLWQLSDDKQVTVHKTQAEADQIYYNMGVLTAEEIRESRFVNDEFSLDTSLDAAASLGAIPPSDLRETLTLVDDIEMIKRHLVAQTKVDASDHSHKDLDGRELGPSYETRPGYHMHFLHGMWSEAKDGEAHQHTEEKTGQVCTEDFPLDPGPDLSDQAKN